MIPLRQINRRMRSLTQDNPLGAPSEPEELLAFQLKAVQSPHFERQFRITPERLFKADFFFPMGRLVVEVQGGIYAQGKHNRGAGMEMDMEKSALIAAMPARLIYVSPGQIKKGLAVNWILNALTQETS